MGRFMKGRYDMDTNGIKEMLHEYRTDDEFSIEYLIGYVKALLDQGTISMDQWYELMDYTTELDRTTELDNEM
jgi:hypothetical protein